MSCRSRSCSRCQSFVQNGTENGPCVIKHTGMEEAGDAVMLSIHSRCSADPHQVEFAALKCFAFVERSSLAGDKEEHLFLAELSIFYPWSKNFSVPLGFTVALLVCFCRMGIPGSSRVKSRGCEGETVLSISWVSYWPLLQRREEINI